MRHKKLSSAAACVDVGWAPASKYRGFGRDPMRFAYEFLLE